MTATMVVGILVLEIRLEGCRSLKDKRHVLRSLQDQARHDFRVSIAEVGDQDLWGNALICASCPSNSIVHAEDVLANVAKLFEGHPEVDLVSATKEYWRPNN